MASQRPRFPLPKGYFGNVQFSLAQQNKYREIARTRVDAALVDEREFVHHRQRQMDLDTWKLVTHKHHLQVYQRQGARVPAGDGSTPSMMSVGRLEGTIEDVIYGSYDKTHEEMKITNSFVDVSTKDCTVLNTIDTATPDDPFHYLGVKWILSKFPIVRQRDWCYLEAMGIKRDVHGERYGYFVLHSVKLKECPPFDRKAAIRGQMFFTFIFRDSAQPGMVEVFSRGAFDPAGELIHQFSVIATAGVLTGIVTAVSCAEAKKLTLLSFTTKKPTIVLIAGDCSVCGKTNGRFTSMRACRICHHSMCSKCAVKKHIFGGRNFAVCRIECCANCIFRAKRMDIRPADDQFSILSSPRLNRSSTSQTISLGDMMMPESIQLSTRSVMNSYDDGSFPTDDGSVTEADLDDILTTVLPDQPIARSVSVDAISERIGRGYSVAGQSQMVPAPPDANEQEMLFRKMVALQLAAKQVYDTTLANQELMHGMR